MCVQCGALYQLQVQVQMCAEFLVSALYGIKNKNDGEQSLQSDEPILANVTQRLMFKKRLHGNPGSTQKYRLTTTSPRETFSTFHLFVHCFEQNMFPSHMESTYSLYVALHHFSFLLSTLSVLFVTTVWHRPYV